MQIRPLGDSALMVELGDSIDEPTHRRVQAAWRALEAERLPGVSETVPAYTSVTLFYDPWQAVQAGAPEADVVGWMSDRVRERLKNPPSAAKKTKPRLVEVPVCYGGDFGPDLGRVAQQAGIFPDDVVKRHSGANYQVYLLGFSPGFPYLAGLPKNLATPRHAKPRMSVPPGSVGIAGEQTGIYPQSTPGGWNLIGRTPLRLFRPELSPPVLLQAGDEVRFRSITPDQFAREVGR